MRARRLALVIGGPLLILAPAVAAHAATATPQAAVSPSPGATGAAPTASASPAPSPSAGPVRGPKFNLPSTLLGLQVKQEDASQLVSQLHAALATDAIGFYSLRRADNFLQATLEVARFRTDSGYQSQAFRLSLVDEVGLTRTEILRAGSTTVYVSGSKGLTNVMWFKGRFMFVLAIRKDFDHPKDLLRQVLGVQP